MRWPTPIQYQDAVSDPARSLLDPELSTSVVAARGPFGAPQPIAGQFAHVYHLRQPDGRDWALRLFLREAADRSQRYAAISRHLNALGALRPLVPFTYVEQGLRVGDGAIYPLVKMDWVEGKPLHLAIEERLHEQGALAALAERFLALVYSLEETRIAHGDLQHDNLLVDAATGAVRLIDYDGMFVPELSGRRAAELGHPAYQHPARDRTHYSIALDRFSALVIYASLTILRFEPTLWYRLHNGDNLIFRAPDYSSPANSRAFRMVREAAWRSPEAVRALAAVELACLRGPLDTPPLDGQL
jgi:aminoglycoside phosphotransferase (APT) family kinase protein